MCNVITFIIIIICKMWLNVISNLIKYVQKKHKHWPYIVSNAKYKIYFRNYLSQVSSYDAVVFHERNVDPKDTPSIRAKKQIYINYNLESPLWERVMVDWFLKIFLLNLLYSSTRLSFVFSLGFKTTEYF